MKRATGQHRFQGLHSERPVAATGYERVKNNSAAPSPISMTETVKEPAREIPVMGEFDVLVAGGGVSGCAAAISSARAGARTVLVERNGCLGGVATATLMANIGNLFLNARGERVVRGFAGELVDRLVEVGAASPRWEHRDVPGCVIDSERLKVVLSDLLKDAGVRILTHALATRPMMRDDTVAGVYLESKSGRQALTASCIVDATGEADLAYRAGADITMDTGSSSVLFKLCRVDIDEFVEFLGQDPEGFPSGMDWVRDYDTFSTNWRERGVLFFPHGGGTRWRFLQEAIRSSGFETEDGPAHGLDAVGMYGPRGNGCLVINSNFYRIEDLDVGKISDFELHAQSMCYKVAEFLKERVPGFSNAYVAHVGVDLGIRTSRAIVGEKTLKEEAARDREGPWYCDDVIGTMPVEDRERESGEFFREFTFDVPYGIMVPQGVRGLLVGSAKSVDTRPRGLIRGMTGCMICGQAAGIACALGAKGGVDPSDIGIRDLQRELVRHGAYLGPSERLEELGITHRP